VRDLDHVGVEDLSTGGAIALETVADAIRRCDAVLERHLLGRAGGLQHRLFFDDGLSWDLWLGLGYGRCRRRWDRVRLLERADWQRGEHHRFGEQWLESQRGRRLDGRWRELRAWGGGGCDWQYLRASDQRRGADGGEGDQHASRRAAPIL
jgi:hypothetical protein